MQLLVLHKVLCLKCFAISSSRKKVAYLANSNQGPPEWNADLATYESSVFSNFLLRACYNVVGI